MNKKFLKELLEIERVTMVIVIIAPTLLIVPLYGLCSIIASEKGISFLELVNEAQVMALVALFMLSMLIIIALVLASSERMKECLIEHEELKGDKK